MLFEKLQRERDRHQADVEWKGKDERTESTKQKQKEEKNGTNCLTAVLHIRETLDLDEHTDTNTHSMASTHVRTRYPKHIVWLWPHAVTEFVARISSILSPPPSPAPPSGWTLWTQCKLFPFYFSRSLTLSAIHALWHFASGRFSVHRCLCYLFAVALDAFIYIILLQPPLLLPGHRVDAT